MNQVILIGIMISIVLGICSFIASNNIFVGVIILVVGVLFFVLIARPIFNKYKSKTLRFRECYHFINTFIVSLSIKGTVQGAYESAIGAMPLEFTADLENVETFTNKEKLEHLQKYFRFHIYSLFLDLVNLYEDQGGDILDMSNYMLDELRNIDEYVSTCDSISKKKMAEFVILWTLSLAIMVFLRFALAQFFTLLSKQLFYAIGIGAISLFCLVSIHMAISRMCKLEIKGWSDVEKI